MFELVIAVSLAVLGSGIVWAHRMSKKVEAEKKTQGYTFDDGFGGLPEPKVYPPMPKVNKGQVPPKAPPPAPSGYVPKPKEWPAPPPPKKVETNLYSNNVSAAPSRPVQPTQPADDGFSTSMMMGAATGSAALGYVVGGNLVGAMLGSAMNSDDAPSHKEEAYEPTPSRHIDEPTPMTSSWSSSTDDDSSSKSSYSSYSSDSSSSYSSSDSSSSSWSSD